MAFPPVQTTSVGGSTTATTTPSITLPTGIQSGDKVVVFLSFNESGGLSSAPATWPAGWSKPTNDYGSAPTNQCALYIAYRDCDGTEGASISPTLAQAGNFSYACYRISGSLAGAPESPVMAVDGTGTAAPDPPSLTPSGGAKDYLWIAATGWDSGLNNWSANPANYTSSVLHFDSSNVAGVAIAGIAAGVRQLNATTDDPATFTLTAADQWEATTVAVAPSGVVPQPPLPPQMRLA